MRRQDTLESIQEDFIFSVHYSISSNMVEISNQFDAVPTVTLNNHGSRTVRALSTGNASLCIFPLAVSVDDANLPPPPL